MTAELGRITRALGTFRELGLVSMVRIWCGSPRDACQVNDNQVKEGCERGKEHLKKQSQVQRAGDWREHGIFKE